MQVFPPNWRGFALDTVPTRSCRREQVLLYPDGEVGSNEDSQTRQNKFLGTPSCRVGKGSR